MSLGIAGTAGRAAAASFFLGAEEVPEQDTQATQVIAAMQAAAIGAIFFINTTT